MTDRNNATGATNTYTYGIDVHGSVSQLIDDAGAVKASYGYNAYGGADAPSTDSQSLTSGDINAQAPLNPYRYSGRRADSGTANSSSAQPSYDMGARRYGPDTGRFLRPDAYSTALGDLDLALDPLTQNRYALAGGNPISYVETDGHAVIADGGGGGSPAPNPQRPSSPSTPGPCSGSIKAAENCIDQNLYNRVAAAYFGQPGDGDTRKIYNTDAKAPGNGIVIARFFIKENSAAGGYLAGDGREFTPAPEAKYRITVAWDTDTGQVSYTVVHSCRSGWRHCADQDPIREGGANSLDIRDQEPGKLTGRYSGLNSKLPCCAVNGQLNLQIDGRGTRVDLKGDAYPDFEAYRYAPHDFQPLGSTTSAGFAAWYSLPIAQDRDLSWLNGQQQFSGGPDPSFGDAGSCCVPGL
jgi:RHS repeat-associated protein